MNAITYYSEAIKKMDEGKITIDEYERMINVLRDVEPVVRCKNCKKAEHDRVFREYWCRGREVDPDGYCSFGERRVPDGRS